MIRPTKIKCPKCERQIDVDAKECPMCHCILVAPEIKEGYVAAFLAILLFKAGGTQTIKLAKLEKFPPEEAAQLHWNVDKQAFTLASPGVDLNPSPIIHNKRIIK